MMKALRRLSILIMAVALVIIYPYGARAKQTIAGYDEHDVRAMLDFAEQQPYKDQLNWSVDRSPQKWNCVDWVELNGVKYLETLNMNARSHEIFGDIDLFGCRELKYFYMACVRVDSVNVSGCDKLEVFHIGEKCDKVYEESSLLTVSKIDFTGCVSLRELIIGESRLKELSLSDCKVLEEFYSYSNHYLESLDLTKCKKLKIVRCSINRNLTSLRIKNLKKHETLEFYGCKVESIDLTGLNKLTRLRCNSKELTALDLSGCPNLQELFCYSNHITLLDLSRCPELKLLDCRENEIEKLTLDCPELFNIDCSDNNLNELDLSKCRGVQYLSCERNNLTVLDMSGCTDLYCSENRLEKLNLSKYRELYELDCSKNNLDKLNLSGCRDFEWLYCSYNGMRKLDITKNTNLKCIVGFETGIESKDNIIGCRKDMIVLLGPYRPPLII